MASTPAGGESIRKVIILVVHGIGEQLRFEQLEGLAAELYKTLKKLGRDPFIQVHPAEPAPRLANQQSWRDTPVTLRWRDTGGRAVEARLREVYWADLDTQLHFAGWRRFIGWALAVSGARFSAMPPSVNRRRTACARRES